jgi:ferredoxin
VTFVITRLCRDCKDFGCLSVCPKDCILEHHPPSGVSDLPNQLFIDPDECIDCNACVPECPWEAIYADSDVPSTLEPDVALNAIVRSRRSEFGPPKARGNRVAEPDAVDDNRQRWGVGRPSP